MGTVINVISGKGGTGKTLMTAVLAEMLGNMGRHVLVVDMDIFVRGLTALLYFQKGESLKLTKDDEWSVSDFFKDENKGRNPVRVAISKYRSFEVLPSVSMVNEILQFSIMPNSTEDANRILKSILTHISNDYDYIFLDSRAGYDELICATHCASNFSLCVEEDDNISMITSDNLISQLRNESSVPILRIKNKARQIQVGYGATGLDFVGAIPFDADVMNNFGTKTFWSEIDKSLYKESLTKVWNFLTKKVGLKDDLPEGDRVSPLGVPKVERRLSMLPSLKRVSFVYGILLLFLGFFLCTNIADNEFIHDVLSNPVRLIGLIGGSIGFVLIFFSVFTGKKK